MLKCRCKPYIWWSVKGTDKKVIGATLAPQEPKLPTVARLAQLDKRRSTEREAAGSSPGRTNTQGL